jgi:YD repeat-containing protein
MMPLKSKLLIGLSVAALVLISSHISLAATLTYTYDQLNRLTRVDYGNGITEQYTYDAAGNRLSLMTSGVRPPTSAITSPADGAVLIGDSYAITGIVSDVTGYGIQKVEVSTDGGATWGLATNTGTNFSAWRYDWAFPADGTYTIQVRATDKAGHVETTGGSITATAAIRQPTTVAVSGRQLLVEGNPFAIKGVGYSPVPIGVDPETTPPYGDYFTSAYSGIYDRDLPLLRKMGANTIRLWGWDNSANHLAFLDQAYNGGVDPIYVIVTFWMGPAKYPDISSPTARAQIKADFRAMVAAYKNHPAVLMWSIGNELNTVWMYGSNLNDLFTLIDEMAGEAHAEEGTSYHPVTTPLMDSNLMSTITTYDASLPSLDIWGANIYRGNTFGTLFSDYALVSAKPLVILEYGIDAYDNTHGDVYENVGTPYQAEYAKALWGEIVANAGVCIGGAIMAYSDEWWKGKYSTSPGCPDTDPGYHSACGYATGSHPDGYANEEWWGIMRTQDNGSGPDIMGPRAIYYKLQSLWVSCKGDFSCDGDGDVDGSDLAVFAADFGRTNCCSPSVPPCEGDFDGDCDVDGSDLAGFAADFGRTDCPGCP